MDRRVAHTIEKLAKSSSPKVLLPTLAKEVNLSPRRLESLFKSQTGMTFVAFRRELRMGRARELLAETFKSIKEIAADLGYNAVEVFCRDFKRIHACTATEFRASSEKVN